MTSPSDPGILRRHLRGLQRRWQTIAGSTYDEETAALRPDLPEDDRPRVVARMKECLDPRGGEIAARARAAALGQAYLALSQTGRREFLRILAEEFDFEDTAAVTASEALVAAETPAARRDARRTLLETVESPRVKILTRFIALPQGVKFLVDLREDLIPLARTDPLLASLDDDLKALLTAWFDPGFLHLERISWDTASGALLEKLMAYEAVHPVESWEDLKNRLDLDRRYFAFFHHRMPQEPLIFLEVALVRELADNIQGLLDPTAPSTDPGQATTAIFYSISNAQRGLAGVSFGSFLIKRVVEELARELPRLKTFATLSPIPGLVRWIREEGCDLLPSEEKKMRPILGGQPFCDWLVDELTKGEGPGDDDREKILRPVLLRLAARYVTGAQREGGYALDPVAHFHLSNGARLERLNWAADGSEKGWTQSAGIMANYLYDSRKIEANHEAYRGQGRVVVSPAVRGLLKG